MIKVIYVEPLAGGWAVRQDEVQNSQVFTSGAKAEDAALRLARRLAAAGQASEVLVYLRDGVLGGRFACPAVASAADDG
jgi:acetylornithine/succinyldiaminopimelate/putrescine aminotransferase